MTWLGVACITNRLGGSYLAEIQPRCASHWLLPQKTVASDAEWKGMAREADGGEEKHNEIGNEESTSSDSSAPRAPADSLKFFPGFHNFLDFTISWISQFPGFPNFLDFTFSLLLDLTFASCHVGMSHVTYECVSMGEGQGIQL